MTFQGSPETSLHGWFLLQHIKQAESLSPQRINSIQMFPSSSYGETRRLRVSVFVPMNLLQ